MLHDGFTLWGMHLFWWLIWIVVLFWIFATPYDIPGQRRKRNSPLNILQRRFASGEISKEEYDSRRRILESDLMRKH